MSRETQRDASLCLSILQGRTESSIGAPFLGRKEARISGAPCFAE